MIPFKLKFPVTNKIKQFKKKVAMVLKNQTGTVIEDSSTGELQISSDGSIYSIHPKCKSTKGVRKIYAKDDQGHWLCWDRVPIEERRESGAYLPYKTKMGVKGNIIEENGIKYFNIKVCWNKNNLNEYENAIKELDEIENSAESEREGDQ